MAKPDPNHLKAHLDPAKSVVVLLPQNPNFDAVAAALSLKLTLEAKQKQVTVVTPTPMTVEFNRLVGVDTIATSFGSPNLVISFHEQSDLVDTVSYDLDKGNLRLIITPKKGVTNLDHRQLKFSPGSTRADVIVTIDVPKLEALGEVHNSAADVMKSTKIVALNREMPEVTFTSVHLTHPESSSLSEMTASLIDAAGYTLDEDIATNLYMGITEATGHFQIPQVTHHTFEIAALLLRRGARRDEQLSATNFPPGSIPNKPLHEQASQNLGYGTDGTEPEEPGETAPEPTKNPPDEWLEPKIYRGPMLP